MSRKTNTEKAIYLAVNKITNKNNLDKIKHQIEKYLEHIIEWNSSHNIISSKFGRGDLEKAVLDSLLGGSFLPKKTKYTDAGSGGGFPAIVLAILYPERKFLLVESSRKKCSFLSLVKSSLSLKNVQIINSRIEKLAAQTNIISRAAFSPSNIGLLAKSCVPGGLLLLWGTQKLQEALEQALKTFAIKLESVHPYELAPDDQRCLLIFKKALKDGGLPKNQTSANTSRNK